MTAKGTRCVNCGAVHGFGAVVQKRGPMGVLTCAKSGCQAYAMSIHNTHTKESN